MKDTVVTIDGHPYTYDELCQKSGLSLGTIRARYRAGQRGRDLVCPLQRSHHQVTVYGKHYTLVGLAHAYGFSQSTIQRRYDLGWRGEKLLTPVVRHAHRTQAHRARVHGHVYTLYELSQQTGIPISTLSARYRTGKRGAALLNHTATKHKYLTQIDGKQYHTFQALGRAYGISPHTLQHRYRYHGMRGRELVQPLQRHHIRVHFHGKVWTVNQLARQYHLKFATVYDRYQQGIRDRRLVRPEREDLEIPFQGKMYRPHELARRYQLSPQLVSTRYYQGKRGLEVVRPARHKRRDYQPIFVQGHLYTFEELSRQFGLSIKTLRARYYQGERDDRLVRPKWQRGAR